MNKKIIASFAFILVFFLMFLTWVIYKTPPVISQMPLSNPGISITILSPVYGAELYPKAQTIRVTVFSARKLTSLVLWINGQEIPAAIPADDNAYHEFTLEWTPSTVGETVLIAQATDEQGSTGRSSPVRVNVTPPQAQVIELTEPSLGETLQEAADMADMSVEQFLAFNPGLDPDPSQSIPVDTPLKSLIFIPAFDQIKAPPSAWPAAPQVPAPLPEPNGNAPGNDPPGFIFSISRLVSDLTGNAQELPTPPQISATVDGCTVRVRVQDNAENESGFFLYRLSDGAFDFQRVQSLGGFSGTGVFEIQDTGPAGNLQYYVSSFNTAGEAAGNIVSVYVEEPSCAGVGQNALGLIEPTIATDVPVDRLYCYASLNGSLWTRLPARDGDFFHPDSNGLFDIGAHLHVLSAPPQTTQLDLECWGWAGGALTSLGRASRLFEAPAVSGPVEMRGTSFTLKAKLLGAGLTFEPEPKPLIRPVSLDEGSYIPAPEQVLALPTEEGKARVMWQWGNEGCFPSGLGNESPCALILDITGFMIYDGDHNLLAVVAGADRREFTVPLADKDDFESRTDCFYVLAFKDDLFSKWSEVYCMRRPAIASHLPASLPPPYNVAATLNPQDCVAHTGTVFLENAITDTCTKAIQSDQVILVWDWQSACEAGDVLCAQKPDGYMIFRETPGGDTQEVIKVSAENTMAILPKPGAGGTIIDPCYRVAAYVGDYLLGNDVMSPLSWTRACIDPSQYGALQTIELIPYRNIVRTQNETRYYSSGNDPADTEYINVYDYAGGGISMSHRGNWTRRTVYMYHWSSLVFHVAAFREYDIQKAEISFNITTLKTRSGSVDEEISINPPESCVAYIMTGSTYLSDGRLIGDNTLADLSNPSTGFHSTESITAALKQVLADGQNTIGLLFVPVMIDDDEARRNTCLSQLSNVKLTITYVP